MKISPRLATLRLILGGFFITFMQVSIEIYRQIQDLGVVFFPSSQLWLTFIASVLISIFLLIILLLTWTQFKTQLLKFSSQIVQFLPSSSPVVLGLLGIVILSFSVVVLFPWGLIFGSDAFRWLVISFVLVIVLLLLRRLLPAENWLNLIAVSGLIVAVFYRIFQFLPDISNYPFSLGWSEASRYYYASLFFSDKIYNQPLQPSTLHPTRYLMQSIPYVIKNLPLWFHRLWQVILWLAGLFGTGILLARRLQIKSKSWRLLFIAWSLLFLWQGPVYYHLLVMVMIILLGFNRHRPWRNLFIVAVASIWAGISRVNWFPMPGLLAAALYFLEHPFQMDGQRVYPGSESSIIRIIRDYAAYFLPPAVWVGAGTLIALVSQSVYIIWSGNDPNQFASSFSSALLWYRLFPNSTYSLGILTGTILISLPIFLLTFNRIRSGYVKLSPVIMLGLSAILGVLLIGGLVVSVKIGGGSNLHNLDAYLVILMVVGSYLYFHHLPLKSTSSEPNPLNSAWLNLLLVGIPMFFSLRSDSHFVQYNLQTTEDSLFKMQRNIERALEDGGEVLFISERQLITFDYMDGITMIPEYEKVFLMEMVMADNRAYLDAFQQDIQSQRFDLIITDPLFDRYKESGESWAEENNIWVDEISVPVLCHYWRKVTFPESGVQILSPRGNPIDCDTALDSDKQD